MESLCLFLALQLLLWLCKPNRDWQVLLQCRHTKVALVSGWLSFAFLLVLLSSASSRNLFSPSSSAVVRVCLQFDLSCASSSQSSKSISRALRSLLHTSLKRRWGRPAVLFPVAHSEQRMSLGIRPSTILQTWPSHLSRC